VNRGHKGESDGKSVELTQRFTKYPGAIDKGNERQGHIDSADQDVGHRQVGQQQIGVSL